LLLICAQSSFAEDTRAKGCNAAVEDEASLNVDPSADIHATQKYEEAVSRMLAAGKFDQLDCLADGLRSSKERFSGGMWKLRILYLGLAEAVPKGQHASEQDWQQLLRELHAWADARPQSVTAGVALAQAYVDFAWEARGHGYADTVSENGWKLFEQRTNKALQILKEADALPTKCPESYVVMLGAAHNQHSDPQGARGVFEKAMQFEPGYYYYARIFAQYLAPQWSGEEGLTERLLQEISDRVGGDDGDILYFQVASTLICGCGEHYQLSWPRIVRGFEATEKKYGPSMTNLNLIAHLATHYGDLDPVVAQKAMSRIGDQWDQEKWQDKETFDRTKQWANTYAPVELKRREMEEADAANMQLPAGPKYKTAFEKRYREITQECVNELGGNLDKFEVLANVGAKGKIEDMRIYWRSMAPRCIYERVHDIQVKGGRPFPAPPHVSYVVRLDLDGADFVPANLARTYEEAAVRGDAQEKEGSTKEYFAQTLLPYFGQKYSSVMRGCFSAVPDPSKIAFAFVAAIGKDGRVQRIYSPQETNILQCLRGALAKDVFPAPPVTPYYLHIDMNIGQEPPSSAMSDKQ